MMSFEIKVAAVAIALGLFSSSAISADYSHMTHDGTEHRLVNDRDDDERYEWGNFGEADDGFALSNASEPVYKDDDDDDDHNDDDRDDVSDDRDDDDDDDKDDDGRDG
ncbi:MAG: hypothetical protein CTY31_00075 [Hyphomicrobium sp.]|nr:MAG: hypothetical protein CTY39_01290 [Hyphomicrobium sp.]PPD01236.1 MAG: hypothetical protein CTY31_00075 [Hyphomicrobium sp.]